MKRDYDETKMKELEQISVTTYNITSNAMMITQVETVAQFGVILVCSSFKNELLGLLCAFLSMSSTAVVLKFLMEKNSISALHGQITVGTLILQDCAVGLLFALLPVLGGTSGVLQGMLSMAKSLAILIAFLAALFVLSRTWVPWFLKLMTSLSSQTNELYQLAAVAFCLLVAWCSDKLGLSLELGSFSAGVMISTTDLAQHTLEQVEPIRNFFCSATVVVAIVVNVFGYYLALTVGMSLAQIGEFAFVLLSRGSNLHLIESKLYLLLLGTTALSLVTTPFLLKLIPAIVHLGVLLRWFSPDSSTEILIWEHCPLLPPCLSLKETYAISYSKIVKWTENMGWWCIMRLSLKTKDYN
ncbi:unnamed protein product [Brassica napus]|uniref:(rape) hypothetical protein n=1 Tax=Brassica napus TaxID=3708 RepID=A0A816YCF6_BRANA|nr:unnamed protein product [Brassica napus]